MKKQVIACAVFDISVQNEGTILLLRGDTDAGQQWLEESLDPEAQRWGAAYVVEHRFVQDILEGAVIDGLELAVQ